MPGMILPHAVDEQIINIKGKKFLLILFSLTDLILIFHSLIHHESWEKICSVRTEIALP